MSNRPRFSNGRGVSAWPFIDFRPADKERRSRLTVTVTGVWVGCYRAGLYFWRICPFFSFSCPETSNRYLTGLQVSFMILDYDSCALSDCPTVLMAFFFNDFSMHFLT